MSNPYSKPAEVSFLSQSWRQNAEDLAPSPQHSSIHTVAAFPGPLGPLHVFEQSHPTEQGSLQSSRAQEQGVQL